MFDFLKGKKKTDQPPTPGEKSYGEELVNLYLNGLKENDLKDLMKKAVDLQSAKNQTVEKNVIETPEYGLVPEKPIFVNGFGADTDYLNHLYDPSGEKIGFIRLGTTYVEGISGPIDKYQIHIPSQQKNIIIYLSVYGNRNSEKAPRGLLYQGKTAFRVQGQKRKARDMHAEERTEEHRTYTLPQDYDEIPSRAMVESWFKDGLSHYEKKNTSRHLSRLKWLQENVTMRHGSISLFVMKMGVVSKKTFRQQRSGIKNLQKLEI